MSNRKTFGATGADLHIDLPLSQIVMDYRPEEMIADMIFPVVTVMKESDAYTIFTRADALRIEDTKRARGTEANKISRTVSSGTYFCQNYALKYPVFLEDRVNADPVYTAKIVNGGAQFVTDKIHLDWENRVASMVTSGSNVGSYSACASAWSDITNSDPLADVNQMIDNVKDSTGKRPNRVTFSEKAWRYFRRNTAIRNLIYGTNNGGGYASREKVAELLEVEQILIGGAYKNSGNEAQAENLQSIWGDHVLVSFTPMSPSKDEPAFGYSFRWAAPGLPNMSVERHPFDTKTKTEEVEVGMYQDEKITGAEYGFLFTNVTSST